MTQRLAEKSVWISGGASGMGQAVAELFAQEGASVTIADIQKDAGNKIADSINKSGGRALFTHCDVANENAVQQSIDAAVKEFGALHIIVNCAGIIIVGSLHETTEADWDKLMDINLKSMFFAFKHAHPHLSKNKRGYVVNIGSVGSFSAQGDSVSYIASKHAVLGLTRAIAMDYAAIGIRSNCICPGITDTPMLRYHMNTMPDPEEALNKRLRRVPMGVAMQPHDIAKAALYLSTEDSSGITGIMLTVDGGYTVAPEWQHPGPPGNTAFMEAIL
jgi:NAD(P)-dependent dehydrogenase (short-subunit alcohol dehydrogenase family)